MDCDKILQTDGGSIITGLRCFSLPLILDCGQAFRWSENADGSWSGVAMSRELRLKQDGDRLFFENTTPDEIKNIWIKYFDLGRDYTAICERLSADENLKTACSGYPGIRILKQDEWETLCSFIISQNNNIPRIKGIIGRLCENFGDKLPGGGYSFPSAEKMASLESDDLAPLRAGFRNKYIIDAARKVAGGEVNLSALRSASDDEVRRRESCGVYFIIRLRSRRCVPDRCLGAPRCRRAIPERSARVHGRSARNSAAVSVPLAQAP